MLGTAWSLTIRVKPVEGSLSFVSFIEKARQLTMRHSSKMFSCESDTQKRSARCLKFSQSSRLFLGACVVSLFFICGCGSNSADRQGSTGPTAVSQPSSRQFGALSLAAAGDSHSGCSGSAPLRTLWEQRKETTAVYDFPLGAGDILNIQAADLPEFQALTVRVAGDGTINLPLIGNMSVGGMNVDQVHDAVSQRLGEYVTHPRVHVYVSEYQSRTVAVMGMVAKPGDYSLSGPSDSILDIVGRAGGVREGAAEKVVLFPAESNADAGANRASGTLACADGPIGRPGSSDGAGDCRFAVASAAADRGLADSAAELSRLKGDPIVIDLNEPALTGCLDIPARPGDIVLIPAAGQVGVYGWVQKAGTFDVTPGMTVLGAVTAAGGAMFSPNAEILRTASTGQRTIVPVDLSDVESGDKPDIPVEAGDLVLVKSSALGLVPYTLSTVINKFGTGMFFPAPF
jgi:polysaccharide biosynthesis/export protein